MAAHTPTPGYSRSDSAVHCARSLEAQEARDGRQSEPAAEAVVDDLARTGAKGYP